MILVEIHNYKELAHNDNFLYRFVPGGYLKSGVEERVAEQIREGLRSEGVDASVEVKL